MEMENLFLQILAHNFTTGLDGLRGMRLLSDSGDQLPALREIRRLWSDAETSQQIRRSAGHL